MSFRRIPDRGHTGGMAGKWRVLPAAGLLACALTLAACAAPPGVSPGPSPRAPRPGAQISADDIPAAELAQAGAAQWQLLAARGAVGDGPELRRVAAVLRRLLSVLPMIDPQLPPWPVQAMVLADPQVDAWCLPGGACAVTRGLLERVGSDDDRLAAALAHELAHVLRGHPAERLALLRQTRAPSAPADWLALPYTRVHETEADRLAVELQVRAGFDPSAPLGFWTAIREAAWGAPTPAFSARHPATPSQLRDLTVYADRLEPLKPIRPANR
ncbi:MAG TPA: M48 family metalloprotease [Burkholderiaceae bacterium]|nr:M48 family metalloprotease [Burkholderiaceae bacterium]